MPPSDGLMSTGKKSIARVHRGKDRTIKMMIQSLFVLAASIREPCISFPGRRKEHESTVPSGLD